LTAKSELAPKPEEELAVVEADDKEEEDPEDDYYQKMKQQEARYFRPDHNPTIKCRNCKEFGHMSRECPNEWRSAKLNCILCGKDGHDSFDCNEKLCFKCNEIGHKASECRTNDIVKCGKCHNVGHRENRCLKVWQAQSSSTAKSLRRCVECGKNGHFKCTSERRSTRVELKFKVKDNLDEFFIKESANDEDLYWEDLDQQSSGDVQPQNADLNSSLQDIQEQVLGDDRKERKRSKKAKKKDKKKEHRERRLSNSNIHIPSDDDRDSPSESESDEDSPNSQPGRSKVQCCMCAGNHEEDKCMNRTRGN